MPCKMCAEIDKQSVAGKQSLWHCLCLCLLLSPHAMPGLNARHQLSIEGAAEFSTSTNKLSNSLGGMQLPRRIGQRRQTTGAPSQSTPPPLADRRPRSLGRRLPCPSPSFLPPPVDTGRVSTNVSPHPHAWWRLRALEEGQSEPEDGTVSRLAGMGTSPSAIAWPVLHSSKIMGAVLCVRSKSATSGCAFFEAYTSGGFAVRTVCEELSSSGCGHRSLHDTVMRALQMHVHQCEYLELWAQSPQLPSSCPSMLA